MARRRIIPGVISPYFLLLVASSSSSIAQTAGSFNIVVDVTASNKPINPLIYGINLATASQITALNSPINRLGGNYFSTYNYADNAINTESDNYFVSTRCYLYNIETNPGCNIFFPNASNPPGPGQGKAQAGEIPDTFIQNTSVAGANAMITVPLIGYIAQMSGTFPTDQPFWSYPQTPYNSQCAVGNLPAFSSGSNMPSNPPGTGYTMVSGVCSPIILANLPNVYKADTSQAQLPSWLAHLQQQPKQAKYILMDNEPSAWWSTHFDVAPNGLHANQYAAQVVTTAKTVRQYLPNSLIIAPEETGWSGLIDSGYDGQQVYIRGPSYNPANDSQSDKVKYQSGNPYFEYLLQFWNSQAVNGVPPVNILSTHFYPDVAIVNSSVSTCGGSSGADSPSAQMLRNATTREFWDPNYVSPGYIGQTVGLIPLLKSLIQQVYTVAPSAPLAITEYGWGDDNCANGATAEADLLGIFGAYGLDMANRYPTPPTGTFVYSAMQIYRNYDGSNSAFGDTSVSDSVSNASYGGMARDHVVSYAALRKSDGALTVILINKDTNSETVSLQLNGFSSQSTAQVYEINGQASSGASITGPYVTPVPAGVGQTISGTLPPQCIWLLVLKKA